MEERADPLIRLPFGPDLTSAGIAWVVRALACGYIRPGGMRRLWRQVAGVGVELALRRLLLDRQIPFRVTPAAPFARPGRYALVLGGRRLHVVTNLITGRGALRRLHHDPSRWWRTQVLRAGSVEPACPMDRPDLCLFAWVTARTEPQPSSAAALLEAGEPARPFCILPEPWRRLKSWQSLGQVTLAGDLEAPVELELGALDGSRRFQPLRIRLAPQASVRLEGPIHSLACLQASTWPDGAVWLSSPRVTRALTILPRQWINLWLYGQQVILAGYLNEPEARRLRQARVRSSDRQALLGPMAYDRLPVQALRSLPELLEMACQWKDSLA